MLDLCHHDSAVLICPKCEGAMTISATATKRRRTGFPLGAVALMLLFVFLCSPKPPQVSIDGRIAKKLRSHGSGQAWQDDDTLNFPSSVPAMGDDDLKEYLMKSLNPGKNESFSQRLYGALSTNPFLVPKKSPNFNSKAVMFHLEEAMLELENQTIMLQNSTPAIIYQGDETEQIPMTMNGNSSTPDDIDVDNATVPSNYTTRQRRTR